MTHPIAMVEADEDSGRHEGNAMSEPIAVIHKNSMEEIRILWSEYKGIATSTSGSTPRSMASPTGAPTQEGRHPAAGADPGADQGAGGRGAPGSGRRGERMRGIHAALEGRLGPDVELRRLDKR